MMAKRKCQGPLPAAAAKRFIGSLLSTTGLNQADLASKLAIAQGTVSGWMHGRHGMDASTATTLGRLQETWTWRADFLARLIRRWLAEAGTELTLEEIRYGRQGASWSIGSIDTLGERILADSGRVAGTVDGVAELLARDFIEYDMAADGDYLIFNRGGSRAVIRPRLRRGLRTMTGEGDQPLSTLERDEGTTTWRP